MTDGHMHRHVTVKKNGLVMRVLCRPIYYTRDTARVDVSPYPYGPDLQATVPTYYLSTLSILHRWTGLTLEYE